MKVTAKVEWANTDSRLEIEDFDRNNVRVSAVYERDTYLTDDATVIIPRDEFKRLISEINNKFGVL